MSDPSTLVNKEVDQTVVPVETPTQQEQETERKFFGITVKTPKGDIQLQTSREDNVQDIKQALFECKEICYLTSYALHFQGQEINDCADLSQLGDLLEEGSVFVIEQSSYTPFTSRLHVGRLRELLSNTTQRPISLLSALTKQIEKNASVSGKEMVTNTKKRATPEKSQNKKGKKGRRNKKTGTKLNNKQKVVAIQTTTNEETPFVSYSADVSLENFFPKEKVNAIRCVQSICYSGWNPPPKNRQCKGDLAYLEVRTLENQTFHITSTASGFYANGNTNSTFNPLPADPSYSAYTLVEVLEKLSPLFKSKFQDLLNEYFGKHPCEVLGVPLEEVTFPWIDAGTNHTNDPNRSQAFLAGDEITHYPDQLRDWNADYQSCKEFPNSTLSERIFRTRSIAKITEEFVAAAVKGAKAVVSGAVQCINPMDPPAAFLYIYNNIFFSHALNGRFLRDENEGDMGPYKLADNDLKGVNVYNVFDVKGLHTVLTVLVNYAGYRIIAQSIIPGILHQTGLSCIQYGSIDHGETLTWSSEFHETLKEAGKLLLIPEHKLSDSKGNKAELCCSSETKGVLGTDGRKYVLDLDHAVAKDVNFPESWALVRHELYAIFIDWKKSHHFIKHKAAYEAKEKRDLAKQAAEAAKKEGEESKPEESKEESKPEEEEEEEIVIPEFVIPTFNPNAFCSKGIKFEDEEVQKEAQASVKELGDFLNAQVIPTLVNEIAHNMINPCDSASLKIIFHNHGINLRYLGKVTELLKDSSPFCRDLMVREMIVRSTKHLLHDYLRTLVVADQASGVSHFLNCFIRGAVMRNYTKLNASQESHIAEKFSVSPSSLWEQIVEKVEQQFKFSLNNEDFQAAIYMLPAVRLLCQKCGITLRAAKYDFYAHEPISEDDVMGLFPVVKLPSPFTNDGRDLIEGGKNYLMQGRLDFAFEFFVDALSIFHQTFGPMHPLTALCYIHLAIVLSNANDNEQALIHQSKAIIILERTQGLDHFETASEYASLGIFYHKAEKPDLALGFLHRALYLNSLISGKNYPGNGTTLCNIATILRETKRYKEAIHYFTSGLEVYEHHKLQHGQIATAHRNIAFCHACLQDFRSAVIHQRKVYEIFSDACGEKDPRTIRADETLTQYTNKVVQLTESKQAQILTPLSNPSQTSRPTDDDIGSLPIRDIMKYINNSKRNNKPFRK